MDVEVRKELDMRILFIGNSHTYMNDMPQLVSEMVENVTGEKCDVVMLESSARSLKWHMILLSLSKTGSLLRKMLMTR